MSQYHKIAVLFSIIFLVTTTGAAATFQVTAVDQDGRDLDGATVALDGPSELSKTTDGDGEVLFRGIPEGRYDVTVSLNGYEEREFETRLYEDVRNNVSVALEPSEDDGDLIVHVEDRQGNDAAAVRVVAEHQASGERYSEHTQEDGVADFDGIPIGEYEVYIDDDDYDSDTTTVDVTARRTVRVELTTRAQDTVGEAVQVRQMVVPDIIRQGTSFDVRLQLVNMQNTTASGVDVSATALDESHSRRISIDPNGSAWVTFGFTPDSIDQEEVTIQATARDGGETDRRSLTVTVGNWAAFLNVEPSDVTVGEPAYVQGRIEDARTGEAGRNIVASLYFDGEFVTSVVSDQTGRFSAFVRPESAGTHRVVLNSSTIYQTGTVRATPDIAVWGPDELHVNNSVDAEACFDVLLEGITEAQFNFMIDGRSLHNSTERLADTETFCYDLETQEAGRFDAILQVTAGSTVGADGVRYHVNKPRTPMRLRTVDIRANLSQPTALSTIVVNPTNIERTVNVSLEGVDELWTYNNSTRQTLTVPAETNRSVTFTITPDETGTFSPSLLLEDGNAERRQQFTITVQSDPERSIISTVERGFWQHWEILAVVLVLLIGGYIVRRDVKQWLSPQSLEPQQR